MDNNIYCNMCGLHIEQCTCDRNIVDVQQENTDDQQTADPGQTQI